MSDGKYGPRVIGAEAFAAQQAARKVAQDQGAYGPRVTGGIRTKAKPVVPAPDRGEDLSPAPADEGASTDQGPDQGPSATAVTAEAEVKPLSIEKMKKALASNTTILLHDQLLAAEFDRPEGEPRKGALWALLAAEQARAPDDGGSRAAVIAEIQKALRAVGA